MKCCISTAFKHSSRFATVTSPIAVLLFPSTHTYLPFPFHIEGECSSWPSVLFRMTSSCLHERVIRRAIICSLAVLLLSLTQVLTSQQQQHLQKQKQLPSFRQQEGSIFKQRNLLGILPECKMWELCQCLWTETYLLCSFRRSACGVVCYFNKEWYVLNFHGILGRTEFVQWNQLSCRGEVKQVASDSGDAGQFPPDYFTLQQRRHGASECFIQFNFPRC